MSAEQDREVEALFESLVERTLTEQEAALAELNVSSPAVVDRVRALLAALRGGRTIAPEIRRPALSPIPQTGDVVGPYLLLEAIGEGGFGVVYRASRRIGTTASQVAVKFFKIAGADPELERRFELERQVLAELSHPGISRLIDGGTTASGVPYLVMDLEEGEPITTSCDHHRRNITQRLDLFVQVCATVEYAHRYQILHRDLKPENILVTREGGVKLLDFGIIKILAPDSIRSSPMSRPGRHLFSLTHASPEQIAGGRLTVASDVYSLGVVLYELVSGRLPFAGQNLWDSAARPAFLAREPELPSKTIRLEEAGALGASSSSTEEASRNRNTRPRHLVRILRGDLDAICFTALRQSIANRYVSVEALRLDVQRFLMGAPVEARRPGRGERMGRWIVRNPVTSAALALAFGLMLYGSHSTSVEVGQETLAESQRQAALDANGELLTVLPQWSRSLPDGPLAAELKQRALAEQLRLLNDSRELPRNLDAELTRLASYSATASQAWHLGDSRQAVDLVTTSIDGLQAFLRAQPGDAKATGLARTALCMRYGFLQALGQSTQAQADEQRAQALVSTSSGDPGDAAPNETSSPEANLPEANLRNGPCPPIAEL